MHQVRRGLRAKLDLRWAGQSSTREGTGERATQGAGGTATATAPAACRCRPRAARAWRRSARASSSSTPTTKWIRPGACCPSPMRERQKQELSRRWSGSPAKSAVRSYSPRRPAGRRRPAALERGRRAGRLSPLRLGADVHGAGRIPAHAVQLSRGDQALDLRARRHAHQGQDGSACTCGRPERSTCSCIRS